MIVVQIHCNEEKELHCRASCDAGCCVSGLALIKCTRCVRIAHCGIGVAGKYEFCFSDNFCSSSPF